MQPSARCGPPEVKATLLRFPATDGIELDGILVGSGPAGVVLLHQCLADLCGFWPYAVYLSERELQALAIDLRCPLLPDAATLELRNHTLHCRFASSRLREPRAGDLRFL